MKFTYWLFKTLGSTTILIIALLGLALVAGLVAAGYYGKDEAMITGFIKQLDTIIDQLKIPTIPGGTIPEDFQVIINLVTSVKDLLVNNQKLIVGVANGVFIGGITFGSLLVVSLMGWVCCLPAHNNHKKSKIKKELIQEHASMSGMNSY